MRNTQLADAAVNAQCDALSSLLDGGYLRIYSGPQPETSDHALTRRNVMLVEFEFSDPAAPAASDGAVEFYPFVDEADAVASGVAEWFRAYMRDGVTPVLDGTVDYQGSNLNLGETSIQVGQRVLLDGLSHTIERSAPGQ